MRQITAREAKEQFDDLLKVASSETVAITSDGRTTAVLVPAETYALLETEVRHRLEQTIERMQRHAADTGLTEEMLEDILKMKADLVVLDTNVLISAIVNPDGKPAKCVSFVLRHGRPLFSQETFGELQSRMNLPRLQKYIAEQDRLSFLQDLYFIAEWVDIGGAPMNCRDPGDDKVLETALAGKADCIVSGDQDLLVLHPFHGIPVLTPAEFAQESGL